MSAVLTAEQQVLGALTIRREPSGDLLANLLSRADPGRLARLSDREGLPCLLYANLKRLDLVDGLPPTMQRDLAAAYRYTAAANMRRSDDLTRLLADLEPLGVNVFVIKGMALLETLYDDLGLRPTGDVDLWVAAENLDALIAVLRDTGYEEQPFYPDIYRRGTTLIDLHTHLLGAERVQAREMIFAAGQDPMFDGGEACVHGAMGHRLAKPQHVFLLGLHLLKHNAERLLWLVEINEMVHGCDDEDWNRLLQLAGRMGQSSSIRQVAFLARLMLPATVAARFRRMDNGLGRIQTHVLRRRATRGALPIWGPLLFFSSQRGAWKRTVSIIETLFPRPATLRQIFRDTRTSIWRLYARRFGQLAASVFR